MAKRIWVRSNKWQRERQTIPWPREKEKDRQYHGQEKNRTDNTMAKLKSRGQTIPWPREKRRTDNTMAKRKREGQTIPWPREKEKDR